MIGELGAQDTAPTTGVAASDPAPSKFALDAAGYLSFRAINADDFAKHDYYREYAGSIFLSKNAGRWLFHSEFNHQQRARVRSGTL
jgi:hypothetical protein